jgi:hypothetical protein
MGSQTEQLLGGHASLEVAMVPPQVVDGSTLLHLPPFRALSIGRKTFPTKQSDQAWHILTGE